MLGAVLGAVLEAVLGAVVVVVVVVCSPCLWHSGANGRRLEERQARVSDTNVKTCVTGERGVPFKEARAAIRLLRGIA